MCKTSPAGLLTFINVALTLFFNTNQFIKSRSTVRMTKKLRKNLF